MMNVTQSFLPDFDEYIERIKPLWESHWLTNNGQLVLELERQLKEQLQIPELLFTNNGTVVLQMALKALGITKEVITTPFSYVATTNAILWEGCTPVFVDINNHDFNIHADRIEEKITENTEAILATHVFGNPCDVYRIEEIARKHKLKVIYDAAHAFGVQLDGRSLFSFGDISTCSFHATKVFHTVEGGMINTNHQPELFKKLRLYRQFGHIGDDYFDIGINAKSSEFHAAMGLCVLGHLPAIIEKRKEVCSWYDHYFLSNTAIQKPISTFNFTYNYAYYPVVFSSEEKLLHIKKALEEKQIMARRYFYPSLNTLPFIEHTDSCPVSEHISRCVLSLPLSTYTTQEDIAQIAEIILSHL